MPGSLSITVAADDDAVSIARIYNHYVADSIATFEETGVDPVTMRERMSQVRAAGLPWLVAREGGRVLAYAYAGPWKARAAYRHSVESSIYLDPAVCARGIGSALYGELLARLAQKGVHTVIGGISLPNAASVALHEKLGFHKVAQFREVGYKFGRWIDVGYWQWWTAGFGPSGAAGVSDSGAGNNAEQG